MLRSDVLQSNQMVPLSNQTWINNLNRETNHPKEISANSMCIPNTLTHFSFLWVFFKNFFAIISRNLLSNKKARYGRIILSSIITIVLSVASVTLHSFTSKDLHL